MESNKSKSCTRSRARHLRRKRLHDARRAEKQQDCLLNEIEVVSYRKHSLSVNGTVGNQEVTVEKDTESVQTTTKRKACKLKKKNKNKSEEYIYPFNSSPYGSPIEPILKCFRSVYGEPYTYDYLKQKEFEIGNISRAERDAKMLMDVFGSKTQKLEKVLNNLENLSDSDLDTCESGSQGIKASKEETLQMVKQLKLVLKKSITEDSVTSNKDQLETELVADPIVLSTENNTDSNLQTVIGGSKEEVSSAQANKDSLNICSSLGNIELDKLGSTSLLNSPTAVKMIENKTNNPEKTREEVKNDRAAKKAAKALAKTKAKTDKVQTKASSSPKPAPADSTNDKQTVETSKSVPSKDVQNKTLTTHITSSICTNSASIETNAEGKSKAELRAERRAKQEAQRAVKQQLVQDKIQDKAKKTETKGTKTRVVHQTAAAIESAKKPATPKKTIPKENAHEINLFKHLYHEREQAIVDVLSVNSHIHPAIVRLGAQYAQKVIVGSNARCVALLAAVKQLILDFERPSQADFIRGLEASLLESMAYLHHCRPSAVSMQNALRHLMRQMTQLPSALSDADAKSKLRNVIDTYIREQIQLADDAISLTIQRKVSNGDVILTYGYSSLIHKILLDAHTAEKQFRVIVVDGRPWLEGKEQLRRLAKHGIECSYILISALSYVMPEVSKVFLGAHAILANGAVMSRAGTAQVALMARAFNIPVLVACETHKSYERVQTDSIVYNELGNADELAQGCGSKKCQLTNWKTKKFLNLLNITYDVTPADLVTAVVTELAILPCTSVPVILRIKPSEI
ncbi:eukaryotic translation initiation factor 2B subunit delta isoform X2 [Halictus rubicundus]